MRVPLTVVVPGLLVGAGLALGGIALAPDGSTIPDITTTTAPAAGRAAPWYRHHETIVGTSAILLDGITIEDGEAVLRYQVLTIAPKASGLEIVDESGGGHGVGVAPEAWVLETSDGIYEGTSRNTEVHEARFAVDDRFLLSKVTALRITRFRMRVPYGYDVTIPTETGEVVTLDDGYTLSIDTILPQATSFIVHIGLEHPSDSFIAGSDVMVVTGIGPEWLTATQRQFGGVQLVREGPEVPDPLEVRVSTAYWVVFDRPVELDIGGLNLE